MVGKRFYGSTPGEAIENARRRLGADPIIINSARLVKRKGLLGLFGKAKYEIDLASAEEVARGRERGKIPPRAPHADALKKAYSSKAPEESRAGVGLDMVHRALKDLSNKVSSMERRMEFENLTFSSTALRECYEALRMRDVDASIAQGLLLAVRESLPTSELSNADCVRSSVRSIVEGKISASGEIQLVKGRPRVVALIGPTGVGKTTTVGKLVGNFFYRSKRVAVVTLDTYRIAASDQLRKTLDHVGVPLKVANTPPQLSGALEGFSEYDLILIDTAGRSQRDSLKLFDLKEFFEVVPPDETHLVISVTTHPDNVFDVIDRFSILRIDRLLLTKLDEASKLGMILGVLERTGKPVSYLTMGQGIPWDIEVASAVRLARLVLGEASLRGE